jgi:hypothetical protein
MCRYNWWKICTFYPGFSELHFVQCKSSVKNMDFDEETQQGSEWFVSNLNLVQLVIQEDFNAFIHCEKLKSYTCILWNI